MIRMPNLRRPILISAADMNEIPRSLNLRNELFQYPLSTGLMVGSGVAVHSQQDVHKSGSTARFLLEQIWQLLHEAYSVRWPS